MGLQLLHCLLFIYLITHPVHGISSLAFPRGTNVTVTFHHQLSYNDVGYSVSLTLVGSSQPVYYRNKFDPRGLRPGQDGRFNVQIQQSDRNLTLFVSISDLQIVDEASYIFLVVENPPQSKLWTYETFLEVIYPPGKAECNVQTSALLDEYWLTVYCNATLGNDGRGHLVCLQNNIQTPYLQPVRHHGTYMTAAFWVNPKLHLRCCSTDNNSTIEKDACNQFVSPNQETSNSSVSPTLITNVLPNTTPPSLSQSVCSGISLQKGTQAVLPCGVNMRLEDVGLVTWEKDQSTLVQTDLIYHGGRKGGHGYDEGLYDINNEFSLIINNVQIMADAGTFSCTVLDKSSGSLHTNSFTAEVFAPPEAPYPTIHECDHLDRQEDCIISNILITCSVHGYYPTIFLTFGPKSASQNVKEMIYSDGTKTKLITIEALPSEQPYVCSASGIPGLPCDKERTASVTVSTTSKTQPSSKKGLIIAGCVILPVLVLLGCFFIVTKRTSIWKYLHQRESIDYRYDEAKKTFCFTNSGPPRNDAGPGKNYAFSYQQNHHDDADNCDEEIEQKLKSDKKFGKDLSACFNKNGFMLTEIQSYSLTEHTQYHATFFPSSDTTEQLLQEHEKYLASEIKGVIESHGITIKQETVLIRRDIDLTRGFTYF